MTAKTERLEVSSLVIQRPDFRIEADFTVSPGERVALTGRSGCGKTSLLRAIAGFESPASGTVRWGDEDLTQQPPEKRRFGFVFQDLALFPALSVLENLEFGLRVRKVPERERQVRLAPWIDRFGLRGRLEAAVGELSGGERQRVALIRTWVTEPRVLLLDEPFTALDPDLRRDFRQALLEVLQVHPVPVLWVTHDLQDLDAFATSSLSVREVAGGQVRSFVRNSRGSLN